MGNGIAVNSIVTEAPKRPFHRNSMSQWLCLPSPLILSAKSDSLRRRPWSKNTLIRLILRQDWQRVLARATLYPAEVSQKVTMVLYNLPLRLLPLHLVCALDPPVPVVELFLKLHHAASMVPVDRCKARPRSIRELYLRIGNLWKKRYGRALILSKGGGWSSFSSSSLSTSHSARSRFVVDNLPRDERVEFSILDPLIERDEMSSWETPLEAQLDCSSRSRSLPEESISSSDSVSSASSMTDALEKKGVILQLSPSGGLTPFPVGSLETESTEEMNTLPASGRGRRPLFGIDWDLMPLWEEMANPTDALLPIHIACLYQAKPQVLSLLLEAHPMGAVSTILGMLPIHLICAGWVLDPLQPSPSSLLPQDGHNVHNIGASSHDRQMHGKALLEAIRIMKRSLPESLGVRSGNHGMTPVEYIAEAMEDCRPKQVCMGLLELAYEPIDQKTLETNIRNGIRSPLDRVDTGSNHSIVFVDSDDDSITQSVLVPREIEYQFSLDEPNSEETRIDLMFENEKWQVVLDLLEDDARLAQKWFYGLGKLPPGGGVVWKRLPIHLACACKRVPIGLVELLLKVHPEGASCADPHTGLLPLHIACQNQISYLAICAVLKAFPTALKAVDNLGRLPLHYAVLAKAPYRQVEMLVEEDPDSVLATDVELKKPVDYAKAKYGANGKHLFVAVVELLNMVDFVVKTKRKSMISSS